MTRLPQGPLNDAYDAYLGDTVKTIEYYLKVKTRAQFRYMCVIPSTLSKEEMMDHITTLCRDRLILKGLEKGKFGEALNFLQERFQSRIKLPHIPFEI